MVAVFGGCRSRARLLAGGSADALVEVPTGVAEFGRRSGEAALLPDSLGRLAQVTFGTAQRGRALLGVLGILGAQLNALCGVYGGRRVLCRPDATWWRLAVSAESSWAGSRRGAF